jgi:putative colanic acid biosynthesis UDP-glucose lipid carrier transferase
MNNRFSRLIQSVILCLDLATLNVLAILVWNNLENINRHYRTLYLYFWIAINSSWLIISWIGKLYDRKRITSFEALLHGTTRNYFYWIVLVVFYLFFAHHYELSRIYVAIVLAGYSLLLFINRIIYFGIRYYFKQSESFIRQVLILGFNEQAKKLANYLEAEDTNTRIIGFCEEEENVYELSNYPILSPIDKAIELSKKYQVSDIYSTIAPEQNVRIYKIMEQADQECIHFQLIPDLSIFTKQSIYVNYLGDMPVLTLRREPLKEIDNKLKKRAFDLVVSLMVTVFILSWLVPILAFIILIDSRGPVFFVQLRTGRNNRPFNCIKFRSMRVNADANTKQATRGDNRITKIGRFLRSTSLDEFPQFINVLKGEMSLVGPRPHMLKHTEDYSKSVDKFMVRHFLKPGITGWAQVNGFRGEIDDPVKLIKRVEHDLWYLNNWSFWLDVKIVFRTFYNVLKGESNAY